jgi:hypothetical protein
MAVKQIVGVTIQVLDKVVTVLYTPDAEVLARQHQLTAYMVLVLARSYGGYPIADMRTFPALVRRGIYEELPTGGYQRTAFGHDLCKKMFVKRSGHVPRIEP